MPKFGLLLAAAAFFVGCGQDGIATTTGEPTSGTTNPTGGGFGGFGGTGGTGGVHAGGGGGTTTSSTGSANGGGGAGGSGGATGSSSSASSSHASSSSSSGSGGAGACDNPGGPTITQAGTGALLLRGKVVTDAPFDGEVLVVGDTITCAAASCAGSPGASGATIVDTHGMIFPGLIDTHNHILFDIFDETDWAPMQAYGDHDDWTNEARYSAMVDCKQYLNGESPSPVDYNCELDKYGELKALVSGTTSVVGAANPANAACYGSLTRTVDQTPNGGLGADKIQVATLFPQTSAADGVCANFASGKTTAYLIHDGEGVNQTALNEFAKLGTITTTDGCLYSPHTTIVHGAAFGDPEFSTMGSTGMNLVWSPRSNVFLYGAGTDLTKTANIPLALSKGINVALAPDWSMGGSQNLLDELRFAKRVSDGVWGSILTNKMLFDMVTTNAAKALALDAQIGSIAAGKKADLMVISGDASAPYDTLLASTAADVRLTIVGGKALYGDRSLESLGPPNPGCEALDVCCTDKFVCVATTSSSDKLNQTYAQIKTILSDALVAYDAMQLTQWSFAPITPLVRCQ